MNKSGSIFLMSLQLSSRTAMDPSVQIAYIPIVSASAVIINNAMLAMMVRITSVIFLIAFIV